MRFSRAVLCIALAVVPFAPSPATALTPHSPVFVERDAAQPISVAAGDEFFIALASNVTTGYSWTPSVGDDKILAYEGNVYQPPASQAMGAGGQQIFIFHANRAGNTTIVLDYGQPFDPAKTVAKTLTFNVSVH
ncbi:MAG: protease inhibitor I42 family protein [Vulcanimicrobiaceae bacterium]